MPANRREQKPDGLTTIVVAVDGSAASERALAWCAAHAERFGAERIVVVHAVHLPHYTPFGELGPVLTAPIMGTGERERIRAIVTDEWCRPLRNAGLDHRVMLVEGQAPAVLALVAAQERASLLVIGSSTHRLELPLHLGCPLVIVP